MPLQYDVPSHLIPRKNVLTQADIEQLKELLVEHQCKFNNVSHEQMDEMVRFSRFFGRVEKKILDSITWALLAIIGGIFYLFYNHGMLRK